VRTEDNALRTRAGADVERRLPLEAHAQHAALWTCDAEGHWSETVVFPFGPAE
jgi:hypothetical protein